MAIGTPTQRYAANSAAQTTSTTFSPTTNTTGGLILFLMAASGSGGKTISSMSDTKGNTWSITVSNSDATRGVTIAWCFLTNAILTTDSITINWSSATSSGVQIWLQEVSGLMPASPRDTITTGTVSSTTSFNAGTTAPLTSNSEIAWGLFRWNNGDTMVAGAGFSLATTGTLNTAAGVEYQIVSSNAAVAVTASGSVSQGSCVGVGATFRANSDNTLNNYQFGKAGDGISASERIR